MADQDINAFLQTLLFQVKFQGIENADAAFRALSDAVLSGKISLTQLAEAYGSVERAARVLAKEYKDNNEAAKKHLKGLAEHAFKAVNGFLGVEQAIRQATGAFKNMVVPSSYAEAVKSTIAYDKSLLNASASVNRLGIGLRVLEGSLIDTAAQVGITREETLKLFDQFQSQMRFSSISEFENILKRIRDMVGSNAEAMGEYQSAISQVSQAYPTLGKALANIEKEDRNAIQNRIRSLYFIGKIGDAEYKRISAYIQGNSQITSEDRKRQEEAKRNIELQQEYKRQIEKVGLAFGKTVLPMLTKMTSVLEKGSQMMKQFGISSEQAASFSMKLGLAVTGIAVAIKSFASLKALGNLIPSRNVNSMKSFMGTGSMGALPGAAAASISSPVPVMVTNLPPSLQPQGPANRGGPGVGIGGGWFSKNMKYGMGVGLAGLGLEIGSQYLGRASEEASRKGMGERAENLKLGSAVADIGGQMAMGAGTGMMFGGPWGAVIGAFIGAVSSVTMNFEYLSKRVKGLFGIKDDKAETEAEKAASILQKNREEEEKRRQVESRINEAIRKDETKSYIDRIKDINIEREEAVKKMEKITPEIDAAAIKRVNQELSDKVKIEVTSSDKDASAAIKRSIAEQESEIATRESALEAMRDKVSSEEIDKQKEIIDQKKENLSKTREIVEKTREQNPELKSIMESLDIIKSREESIVSLRAMQRTYAAALSDRYQAQVGFVDSLVEKLSIAGQIDMAGVTSEIQKGLEFLDEEIKAQKELLNLLTQEGGTTTEQLAKARGLTAEQKKQLNARAQAGDLNIDVAESQTFILQTQSKINSMLKEQSSLLPKITEQWSDQLQYLRATADRADALVQLADNYAIGVGASAEMRMNVFKAEEDYIQTQKQQLSAAKEALMMAEKDGSVNVRLRTKVRDIETNILQSQLKQASIVKSLRDNWISALSAMNVGADSFSSIVMNAEQNTAQIMRLGGAVRSAASGAFAMRDAFGKVKEYVGFVTSEKMTQFGQISSMEGRRGYERAYWTPTEERLIQGGYRGPEYREKMEIGEMVEGIRRQTQYAAAAGQEATAAAGNRMVLSAVTEAGRVFRDSKRSVGGDGGYPTIQYPAAPPQPKTRDVSDTEQYSYARDVGKMTAESLQTARGDTVPVFVSNFQDLMNIISGKPLVTKNVAQLSQPMSQRETVAHIEAVGDMPVRPSEEPGKVISTSAIIKDEGLTSEIRKYFKELQNTGIETFSVDQLESEVYKAHESIMAGYKSQLNIINEEISKQESMGGATIELLNKRSQIERDINSVQETNVEIVKNIKKKVQERLEKDPLQIFYPKISSRIDRIAYEVGLPSEEVMTYYKGFTERIDRTAEEQGLPPSKIATLYQGFTEKIERIASNEGLPPTEVLVNYSGFVSEISRIAKEFGLPPDRIVTRYTGFTKEIQRYADQVNLDTSDLLVRYEGISKDLTRQVEETGLTTDELMMIYEGQIAKEEVVRKVREKNRIPDTIDVDYDGIVRSVTSTLDHIGLPKEQVPVYYRNVVDSIMRYAKNMNLPTNEFIVKYRGAVDYITKIAKNKNLPTGEFLMEYEGFTNEFFAEIQEKNIPPDKIPLFLKGYHTELERGVHEVGLPLRNLIVRYPQLADLIERKALEVNKPASYIWLYYSGFIDKMDREAKNVNLPTSEFLVRYIGAIDEIEKNAKMFGLPSGELLVSYPKVTEEIEMMAKEFGLPTSDFIVKYTGISQQIERVARETNIPQDDLVVRYSGFSDMMSRGIKESGFPEDKLNVLYDGFSAIINRGITEEGLPTDKDKLQVLYEKFTEIIHRGVKENLPDDKKLEVIFQKFTDEINREINEQMKDGRPLKSIGEQKLKIFYDSAMEVMKRGVLEIGAPSGPLIVRYQEIKKRLFRAVEEHGIPEKDIPVFLSGFTDSIYRTASEFGMPDKDIFVKYTGFTKSIKRIADEYNIPEEQFPIAYTGITQSLERVANESGIEEKDLAVWYSGFSSSIERGIQESGLDKSLLPVFYRGFTDLVMRNVDERGIKETPLKVQYEDLPEEIRRSMDNSRMPQEKKDKLVILYDELVKSIHRRVVEKGLNAGPLISITRGFTDLVNRGVNEFNLPTHKLLVNYPDVARKVKLLADEYNMPPDKFMVYYGDVTRSVHVAAQQLGLPDKDLLVKYEQVAPEITRMANEVGLPSSKFMVYYQGITQEIERTAKEIGLDKNTDLSVFYSGMTDVLYRGVDEKRLNRENLPVVYNGLSSVLHRMAIEPEIPDVEVDYGKFRDEIRRDISEENLPDKDLRVIYDEWIKEARIGVKMIGAPKTGDEVKLLFENYDQFMKMKIREINKPDFRFIIKYPQIKDQFKMIAKQVNIPDEKFWIFYEGYMNTITRTAINQNLPDKEFIVRYANVIDSMTRMVRTIGVPEKDVPLFLRGVKEYYEATVEEDKKPPSVGLVLTNLKEQYFAKVGDLQVAAGMESLIEGLGTDAEKMEAFSYMFEDLLKTELGEESLNDLNKQKDKEFKQGKKKFVEDKKSLKILKQYSRQLKISTPVLKTLFGVMSDSGDIKEAEQEAAISVMAFSQELEYATKWAENAAKAFSESASGTTEREQAEKELAMANSALVSITENLNRAQLKHTAATILDTNAVSKLKSVQEDIAQKQKRMDDISKSFGIMRPGAVEKEIADKKARVSEIESGMSKDEKNFPKYLIEALSKSKESDADAVFAKRMSEKGTTPDQLKQIENERDMVRDVLRRKSRGESIDISSVGWGSDIPDETKNRMKKIIESQGRAQDEKDDIRFLESVLKAIEKTPNLMRGGVSPLAIGQQQILQRKYISSKMKESGRDQNSKRMGGMEALWKEFIGESPSPVPSDFDPNKDYNVIPSLRLDESINLKPILSDQDKNVQKYIQERQRDIDEFFKNMGLNEEDKKKYKTLISQYTKGEKLSEANQRKMDMFQRVGLIDPIEDANRKVFENAAYEYTMNLRDSFGGILSDFSKNVKTDIPLSVYKRIHEARSEIVKSQSDFSKKSEESIDQAAERYMASDRSVKIPKNVSVDMASSIRNKIKDDSDFVIKSYKSFSDILSGEDKKSEKEAKVKVLLERVRSKVSDPLSLPSDREIVGPLEELKKMLESVDFDDKNIADKVGSSLQSLREGFPTLLDKYSVYLKQASIDLDKASVGKKENKGQIEYRKLQSEIADSLRMVDEITGAGDYREGKGKIKTSFELFARGLRNAIEYKDDEITLKDVEALIKPTKMWTRDYVNSDGTVTSRDAFGNVVPRNKQFTNSDGTTTRRNAFGEDIDKAQNKPSAYFYLKAFADQKRSDRQEFIQSDIKNGIGLFVDGMNQLQMSMEKKLKTGLINIPTGGKEPGLLSPAEQLKLTQYYRKAAEDNRKSLLDQSGKPTDTSEIGKIGLKRADEEINMWREKEKNLQENISFMEKSGKQQAFRYIKSGMQKDRDLAEQQKRYAAIGDVSSVAAIREQRDSEKSNLQSMQNVYKAFGGIDAFGKKLGESGISMSQIDVDKLRGKSVSDIQGMIAKGGIKGLISTPGAAATSMVADASKSSGSEPTDSPAVRKYMSNIPLAQAPATSNIFAVTLPVSNFNIKFENVNQFAEEVSKKVGDQIQKMRYQVGPMAQA